MDTSSSPTAGTSRAASIQSSDLPPEATTSDATLNPERLFSTAYADLRRLAARKLFQEAPGQTLQPADLVHEAWLRMGADHQPNWKNRSHLLAAAANAMRRVLVDRARRRRSLRHGGEARIIELSDAAEKFFAPQAIEDDLRVVQEAMDRLATLAPRKAAVVKLRYFSGMSISEAARLVGISEPTAKRDWLYARAWLYREIQRLR
jgi:RNA polymerase sigma factor (TIGR02999 family)